MGLFQTGDFVLRSGARSRWKIECDALTPEDWDALALMAIDILPAFNKVEPVPRGGIPFAKALEKYAAVDLMPPLLLICEDVVTTGTSMERIRDRRDAVGVCVFARGRSWPFWVKPLFTMSR